MKLRKTLQAAALGLVQATTSVPTTVATVGTTLFGVAFATSAQASEERAGAFVAMQWKNTASANRYATYLANSDGLIQKRLRSLGVISKSNSDAWLRKKIIDEIEGIQFKDGTKLKDHLDGNIEVQLDYKGVEGKKYIADPRNAGQMFLSLLNERSSPFDLRSLKGDTKYRDFNGRLHSDYTDDCGPIINGQLRTNTPLRQRMVDFCFGRQ